MSRAKLTAKSLFAMLREVYMAGYEGSDVDIEEEVNKIWDAYKPNLTQFEGTPNSSVASFACQKFINMLKETYMRGYDGTVDLMEEEIDTIFIKYKNSNLLSVSAQQEQQRL